MPALGIRIRELTFYYTPREILFRRFSLEVPPRTVQALIGPNGSGKSSLLWLIAGFYQPVMGRITYYWADGRSVDAARAVIAPAGPMLAFPPMWTVDEVVRLHHTLKPRRDDLWPSLWGRSGLEPHRRKRVGHLSSGLYQRLRLLLAFGTDAPLLLLDEPTSYLDADGRAFYHDAMAEWCQDRTVVIASNDPAEYEPYATARLHLSAAKR